MSSSEKGPLPSPSPPVEARRRDRRATYLAMLPGVLLAAWLLKDSLVSIGDLRPSFAGLTGLGGGCRHAGAALAPAKCPRQPAALNVGDDWNPVTDSTYAELAARRLSEAVQHDTESFDDLPDDPTDSKWDKLGAFNDWLYAEYPLVFSTLKHDIVNTHGNLLTWPGSKPDLEPMLWLAHTDVVPVLGDTRDDWTFPPFEGKITHDYSPEMPGAWIWGRGASDCKNTLMSMYGAVERSIKDGWKPERTLLIANGFDEEIGGPRGARSLSKAVAGRYKKVAFLVDEGLGVTTGFGKTIVNMGMGEKGAINLQIRVETPGGHSSQPEKHTGIGVMADLLYHLEKNPFKPHLSPEEPYLKYLTCLSEHAPDFPPHWKKQVQNPRRWPQLAEELAKDKSWFSFLSTTQAIDVIKGGLKRNALPEVVETVINYRIAFTSSVADSKAHIMDVISPIAKRLNFTLSAFEPPGKKKSDHHITVWLANGVDNGNGVSLEPAPLTPGDTKSWDLLAGTSKHVFGEDAIVTPSGMFANTDSKWFWNLTDNIYRFNPTAEAEDKNRHTVNEDIAQRAPDIYEMVLQAAPEFEWLGGGLSADCVLPEAGGMDHLVELDTATVLEAQSSTD